MSFYRSLLLSLPDVKSPERKQTLKKRLFWTFGILVLFLFLASIPLFGLVESQMSYFKSLELLLGAKIGKLLTLGIGPIVTSSIVLQLLRGSGILNFDLSTQDGKFLYTGTHKLLTFVFIILEAIIYVAFGAVSPSHPSFFWLIVLQLALGGFLVFYMDEIVKKWGFGSGVSLFIAAGIGQAVFLQLFSPFTITGELGWAFGGVDPPIGKFFSGLYYLSQSNPGAFFINSLGPIAMTVFLFFVIVFFQSVNVEIPLSFGRVRGQSIKWPLNFFYSGVIPVILVSALRANLQLWAGLFQRFAERAGAGGVTRFFSEHVFGQIQGNTPVSGLINWIYPVNIWNNLGNLFTLNVWPHILTYILYMVLGATLFAYFWVQTSGQDSKSVSNQILKSGLQIPGFRRDPRIIERVLDRYIIPLTIMGGIGIGFLASSADVLGALASGTGILLLIMIIYQFYQTLARESMEDFSVLRKLMKK